MFRAPVFSELVTLRNDVERITSPAIPPDSTQRHRPATRGWAAAVPVEVYSTADHAVVIAALPGLAPDDVDIAVHQNTVTLSGTLRNVADSDDAKDATWYVSELASGAFRRTITLPFQVDADKATAWAEHGILRITLPKVEAARARRIKVSPGGRDALSDGKPAA